MITILGEMETMQKNSRPANKKVDEPLLFMLFVEIILQV